MGEKKIFINAFIGACISVFIPLFIWGNTISHFPWMANKLNMDYTTIGSLLMFFSVVHLFTSQIVGRFVVKKIGSKKTLFIGSAIFSTAPYFFGLTNSINLFLFASIPCGIGMGFIFSTAHAVTGIVENKTGKILQTLLGAFIGLGVLLGGLCSSIIHNLSVNSEYLFFSLIILNLISSYFVFKLSLSKQYDDIGKIEKFKIPEKKILILGFYVFIFLGSMGGISDWAPMWFERELLTSSHIASLTIVFWGLGETVGKFFGAPMINYYNEKIVGVLFGLVASLTYYIIINYDYIYLTLFGLFLIGFGTANFFPVVIRVALRNSNEDVNTTSANITTIGFCGYLVGPALIGYSADTFSIGFNVKLVSIVWIITFIIFLVTFKKFD